MAKASELVELVEQAYAEKWGYIWGTAGETWTAKKQEMVEKNYASDPTKYHNYDKASQYGKKWIGHTVADCSGLPYCALKKLGIKIYHGSNSIWNKGYLSHKGKITPGMKLPIGAAIFTGTEKDHPHIGTLVTETCVNEAKGTTSGVVHTALSNKKWTYWGLYKGVEYDFIPGQEKPTPPSTPSTPSEPVESSTPTIRKGDKGDGVRRLQELLLKAGESLPRYGADGDFGNETSKAVKHFQTTHGLKADGIVGKLTWAELVKYA